MPEMKFRKGDRVRFRFVTRFVEGVVKEDRGPIGINGRHLYVVEFRYGPHGEFSSRTELPAVELQLIPDAVSKE
jgi:hypothetical protein